MRRLRAGSRRAWSELWTIEGFKAKVDQVHKLDFILYKTKRVFIV